MENHGKLINAFIKHCLAASDNTTLEQYKIACIFHSLCFGEKLNFLFQYGHISNCLMQFVIVY